MQNTYGTFKMGSMERVKYFYEQLLQFTGRNGMISFLDFLGVCMNDLYEFAVSRRMMQWQIFI